MLLKDLFEMNMITVRVDKEFSDLTFDFEMDGSYEDISEVPEKLHPLVQVITPIEGDYRSQAPLEKLKSDYESSPELAYYVGTQSGKMYQQDLLNIPQTVFEMNMSKDKFLFILNKHIVKDRPSDANFSARH